MKTIQVDEGTWKALKFRALEEGRTLATVVADAVARYVRKAPSGCVAEKNASAARVAGSDLMHGIPAAVESNDFAGPSAALSREDPPRVNGRRPDTVCARCGVPWKNHQEGSRKNRAGTTGCTAFEDPS